MRVFVLVLLVACGPKSASPPADTGQGRDAEATPVVIDATAGLEPTLPTPSHASADEDAVRAWIAGERTMEDVLATVSWSGGFPVPTSAGTWLFMVEGVEPGAVLGGTFDDWVGSPLTVEGGVGWVELTIPEPQGALYKVRNRGAWFADAGARSFTYDAQGEVSYVDAPVSTWRLDRYPGLEGAGLAPRDVHVYVPPGLGPWATLYAHDGQNLFDPAAPWGGWRLQDALQGLEVVVVGVFNTPDRLDEYTHVTDEIGHGAPVGGRGDAYADLLHGTLRPRMEDQYGPSIVTGVLGASLGGLISLHIVSRYEDHYDFVAGLSPTLGWGAFGADNPTMEDRWLASQARASVVYVDSGGSAGDDGVCRDLDGDGHVEDDPDGWDNYCETRAFADALADSGWRWGKDLHHWHEAGAGHNEAAWGARVHRPLGVFADLAAGAFVE